MKVKIEFEVPTPGGSPPSEHQLRKLFDELKYAMNQLHHDSLTFDRFGAGKGHSLYGNALYLATGDASKYRPCPRPSHIYDATGGHLGFIEVTP